MAVISIITSSLNALPLLQCTADSIFKQSFTSWQWIVIDGASTDGTPAWLDRVTETRPNIIYISEPDKGIYDAWNKALPKIKGEWVIFLGAGDKFKSQNTLSLATSLLMQVPQNTNLAYGMVEYINGEDEVTGVVSPAKWHGVNGPWMWCRPTLPNHQGVFHRSAFLKNTCFDSRYRFAGDTAMILPELLENGAAELNLPIALRIMDGTSLNHKNRVRVLLEVLQINRKVGLGNTKVIYQYSAFAYHWIKSSFLRFRCKN